MSNHFTVLHKEDGAHTEGIWAVTWVHDAENNCDLCLTGGADGLVKCWRWNGVRLEELHKFEGHNLGVVGLTAHGDIAASVGLDCSIRLWDLKDATELKCIDGGPADAWSISFSPDGSKLATGANGGNVRIIDTQTTEVIETIQAGGKFALSICYSPDGELLAIGGMDGIIKIFSTSNYELMKNIEGHAMPIRSLAFSADSQFMMSASDDGHIKVYDAKHANLVGTLSGHSGWVLSVCFGPDNHAVSCSSDRTVKVWNVGTRQCIHTFSDHSDMVWGARYSSSGSHVVSAGDDCAIHVYDCPV